MKAMCGSYLLAWVVLSAVQSARLLERRQLEGAVVALSGSPIGTSIRALARRGCGTGDVPYRALDTKVHGGPSAGATARARP